MREWGGLGAFSRRKNDAKILVWVSEREREEKMQREGESQKGNEEKQRDGEYQNTESKGSLEVQGGRKHETKRNDEIEGKEWKKLD